DTIKLYGKEVNRDSITSALKGDINTRVALKILRKGEKTPMEVYVVRREVPIKSVDAGFMLNENMGYIKINRFAETTYDEFKTALKKLLDHDMKSLVLDLRDNPGGYVYAAEQI